MPLVEPRIPIPLRPADKQRGAQRFGVEMPVRIEGRETTTHDLSANGLSFESEHGYEVGERITVVIDYLMDGHNFPLRCEVEIARVEPDGGRFRVGARLLEPLTGEPGAAGA